MARVVVFAEYGEPEVLHVIEVDDPIPAANEMRIRVKAAGVQPYDAAARRGTYASFRPATFPAQLGNEAAGIVDMVDKDVEGFAVGDEVIAFLDGTGYGDTTLARGANAVRKPSSMPWPEAGVISASGQTAKTALDELGVAPGDRLLIHAAAGGVGSFAVQLAVARGASVVGTASPRNHEYLASLGAVPVAYGPGLEERVRDLLPEGITAALDCVGGEVNEVSVALVGSPVRAVTLVDFDAEQRVGVRLVGTKRSAANLGALTALYEAGSLRVEVANEFSLEEAHLAHREIESRHVRGKIALVP